MCNWSLLLRKFISCGTLGNLSCSVILHQGKKSPLCYITKTRALFQNQNLFFVAMLISKACIHIFWFRPQLYLFTVTVHTEACVCGAGLCCRELLVSYNNMSLSQKRTPRLNVLLQPLITPEMNPIFATLPLCIPLSYRNGLTKSSIWIGRCMEQKSVQCNRRC